MSATAASLPASGGGESAHAGPSSGAAANSAPSSVVPKTEQTDALPSGGGAEDPSQGAVAAPDGPIRAYAKLEFPGFSYYVQTLQVTIGRRPGQLQGAHAAPVRAPTPSARHGDVDVDLGPLKSISRLHARIFYSTQPHAYRHRTHLSPMLTPGGTAPDARDATSDAGASGADEGRFLLEVLGRNGAFVDDVWVRMNGVAPLGRRTKIQIAERVFYFVLPPPAPVDDDAASATGSESGVALSDDDSAASSELSDVEQDAAPAPAPTSPAAPKLVLKARAKLSPPRKDAPKRAHDASPDDAHAKRRRAGSEATAPLPIGTPIGIEALKPPRGKGKGKGKSKADAPPDAPAAAPAPAADAEAAAAAAFQKPELSNVELITNALRSDACLRKGHKLTLQEVYEWLQHTYPWFAQNGRKTGRDWQSSIRHTIGTSREFVKIPRRADEHGKGIFYALATSDVAQAHEAARRAAPAASPPAEAPPEAPPAPAPTAPAPAAPAPAAPAAAAEAPAPRIPLVVGVPPGAETRAPRGKHVPGSIESLLDTPPIAHHQGKLYLSPKVFGHLTAEQLQHIEGLGAQQALQVLQAYLVSHLKERMKKPEKAADGTAKPAAAPAASPPPSAAPKPAAASTDNRYDQRLEAPKVPRIPVASPAPPAPAARSSIPPAAPPAASPPPAAPAASAAPRSSPAAASIPPAASRAPDAANPLAALSALAAHPEAAGLMALLQKQQSGAAGGTVKLTPKQLELLQLANQLAMQKKKKKAASAQVPDARAPTPGAATTSTSAAQSPPPPPPPPP
ncbi:Pre-rRNA-processing protein fhl1 [Malassezia brasiliensis]|uniref:Pre-rRNA-processing protein fhl1 n=1 Tax=Malassezia brasiliensis TaxID=1821822 RepID=A0AAF0DY43_9BASI|nr:Pre-rRNA-processing protein fhl1 [Malassezia brasiliensis]